MKELDRSKDLKMIALKTRVEHAKKDEEYLWDLMLKNAQKGEMSIFISRNAQEEYPVYSAEFIKQLKDKGFQIKLFDKGWDDLHRWYKGALRVSWYK